MLHDPHGFAAVEPFTIFDAGALQNNLGGSRPATSEECEAYARGLALRHGLASVASFRLVGAGYYSREQRSATGGTFGAFADGEWPAGSYSVPFPQLRRETVELIEFDEAGEIARTSTLPIDPKKGGIVWKADHVRRAAGAVPKPARARSKAAETPQLVRGANALVARPCACVEPYGSSAPMSPADLVKHVRTDVLNLKQHEFAEFLRLGPTGRKTVQRWESGETEPLGPILMLLEAIREGWRPKA